MTETNARETRPYMTRAELYHWVSAINEPITDEVINSACWQIHVQDNGHMDKELDTLVASNWATALIVVLRNSWEEVKIAQRMLGKAEPPSRISYGAALIRSGVLDRDDVDLLQWHPCGDCPNQGGKCACSGVPYVSDAVWGELCAPVVAGYNNAHAVGRVQVAEMVTRRLIAAMFRDAVPADERFL